MGGMRFYPNRRPRPLCKPWQRAQSEVPVRSSLRNCSYPFIFPGHLLVRQRRKGKGKRQEEGKSRNEEKKEDEAGGEKKKGEKRSFSELPAEAASKRAN